MLDIDTLAAQDQIPLEFNSAFQKILLGLDFTQDETLEISRVLVKVAVSVKTSYEGKIQSVLRKYGDMIREELLGIFSDNEIDEDKINRGVSLWLQSAFGLPILSEKPAVKEYLDQQGISKEKLVEIADEIDVNLGVIDYFIEKSV